MQKEAWPQCCQASDTTEGKLGVTNVSGWGANKMFLLLYSPGRAAFTWLHGSTQNRVSCSTWGPLLFDIFVNGWPPDMQELWHIPSPVSGWCLRKANLPTNTASPIQPPACISSVLGDLGVCVCVWFCLFVFPLNTNQLLLWLLNQRKGRFFNTLFVPQLFALHNFINNLLIKERKND